MLSSHNYLYPMNKFYLDLLDYLLILIGGFVIGQCEESVVLNYQEHRLKKL